ncbi:MAG: helix-turn-helix domain-containing protein [Clostridia bacterium]|nr:helix-turn-helix domain-containing protein [Clostridia bacterium]
MTIEIANKLIELRKNKGLSQEELADRLGISRQAVSKWERAESSPDIDNIMMLSKLYGISVDELLLNENASSMDEAELETDKRPAGEPAVGTADGIMRLRINVRGSVDLLGTDDDACSVVLTGADAEKEKVHISRDGDTFVIEQEDQDEGFFGRMFNFNRDNLCVTVRLPRRMTEVDAALKGGSLSSSELSAGVFSARLGGGRASVGDGSMDKFVLKTGGGSIIVKNVSGASAELKTGGGSIKAENISFRGRVEAKTGGGSVMLSGLMREVEAGSGGGDVRLFVRDADQIKAETGGGGVAIELTETDGASAELKTGGGRARLSVDGNEVMSGKSVSASVGTGRTKVRASSGGGSVSLSLK